MSIQFCCLARSPGEIESSAPAFVHYAPALPLGFTALARASVVLGAQAEATASALLEAGVSRVLVGEAALRDAGVIDRLLQRFGAARLGLHVPVRRQAVSWSFDTESNEDFNVVTPSLCAPGWEVLLASGEPSGILAEGWLDTMLRRGLQTVLLRADIQDDADLNLCAGMVEKLGSRLWLAPLTDPEPAIADWISYGQATQLALPAALYRRRAELLPRPGGANPASVVRQAAA
jgi:hypothetical protein